MSKKYKQTKENNEQNDTCKKELQEWKDKFVHVSADLQNYRRRVEKEKVQWIQIAQGRLIKDLLPVLDDFERASAASEKQEFPKEIQDIFIGFAMIGKSLQKILQSQDVQEIVVGETFDPTLHEAIVQLESTDHESGEIIEVVQKGYTLKDQVIRPSKVTVAK